MAKAKSGWCDISYGGGGRELLCGGVTAAGRDRMTELACDWVYARKSKHVACPACGSTQYWLDYKRKLVCCSCCQHRSKARGEFAFADLVGRKDISYRGVKAKRWAAPHVARETGEETLERAVLDWGGIMKVEEAEGMIEYGRVTVDGEFCFDPQYFVKPGERVKVHDNWDLARGDLHDTWLIAMKGVPQDKRELAMPSVLSTKAEQDRMRAERQRCTNAAVLGRKVS